MVCLTKSNLSHYRWLIWMNEWYGGVCKWWNSHKFQSGDRTGLSHRPICLPEIQAVIEAHSYVVINLRLFVFQDGSADNPLLSRESLASFLIKICFNTRLNLEYSHQYLLTAFNIMSKQKGRRYWCHKKQKSIFCSSGITVTDTHWSVALGSRQTSF